MKGLRYKIKRDGVVIWSCSTKHEANDLVTTFKSLITDNIGAKEFEVVDSRPGIVYNGHSADKTMILDAGDH